MNLSKFRRALRSMRADYITDKDAEVICSLHYKARIPLWFAFGIANGYLETLPVKNNYIPVKFSEKGFKWLETWKHNHCISGKKIIL